MRIHGKFVGMSLICVIFALVSNGAEAESFIVKDGKANAEIIISPEPTRTVKLAAEELQHFIKKISGAELPILNKPSSEDKIKIYLGESEYTKKLGLLYKEYKYGSYRIASGKDYLSIVGYDKNKEKNPMAPKDNDDVERAIAEWNKISGGLWRRPFRVWSSGKIRKRSYNSKVGLYSGDKKGTLNGVYDFLRSLGVRWYFPGELGECVPEMKSIKLPEVNKEVIPDCSMRYMAGRDYTYSKISAEQCLWNLRLGLGGIGPGAAHGVDHILRNEETAKKHPEWYRLVDGKREASTHGGRPCLSAKGLREEMVKYGRVYLDLHKYATYGIGPTDGMTFICQCDLCKGKDTPERGFNGGMSDYVWDYYKEVAAEIYKTHPDRRVGGIAYNMYVLPPEKIDKMPPNFSVMLSHNRYRFGDPRMRKASLDVRNALLEKLTADRALCFHDNYSIMGGSAFPIYIPRIIAEDIRLLDGNTSGSYIEENSRGGRGRAPLKFAINHLNIYVTSRCWWDNDLDIDALLNEYYEKFYGPASKEMKAFIEFCEANWAGMKKDVSLSNKALELIEAAKKAASKETIYGERVYLVDTYLDKLRKVKDKVAIGRSENTPAVMVDKSGKDVSVKLDGKFEEDFWKDAKTYYLREARTGEKPEFATSFRPVWKDDKLYLAIHCEESDTKNFNIGTTKNDDAATWNGETLEIFIETQNHAFYQIAINPSGAMLDADQFFKMKTLWSSEAKLAIDVGEDYWNVEMEFPIAGPQQEEDLPDLMISGSKPTKDNPWHINVCRYRNRGKGKSEITMFGRTDLKGKLFLNRDRFCPFYIEE